MREREREREREDWVIWSFKIDWFAEISIGKVCPRFCIRWWASSTSILEILVHRPNSSQNFWRSSWQNSSLHFFGYMSLGQYASDLISGAIVNLFPALLKFSQVIQCHLLFPTFADFSSTGAMIVTVSWSCWFLMWMGMMILNFLQKSFCVIWCTEINIDSDCVNFDVPWYDPRWY